MNLQPITPLREDTPFIQCSHCCKMKDQKRVRADLDTMKYVCTDCIPYAPIEVKVTMQSGNSFNARVNSSLLFAQQYYFNQVKHRITECFETGQEFKDLIVSVELLGG